MRRRREQRENWAEAIDLINQILKKKPGGTLEAAAKSKLQYLTARKEAQEKYDAGDYRRCRRCIRAARSSWTRSPSKPRSRESTATC